MVRTGQCAIVAMLPTPTFENPIAKYEVDVKQLEDLLAKFRYDQEDQDDPECSYAEHASQVGKFECSEG